MFKSSFKFQNQKVFMGPGPRVKTRQEFGKKRIFLVSSTVFWADQDFLGLEGSNIWSLSLNEMVQYQVGPLAFILSEETSLHDNFHRLTI